MMVFIRFMSIAANVDVVYFDDVLGRVVAEFVSSTVVEARLDAATREPHGEAFHVVIAAIALAAILGEWSERRRPSKTEEPPQQEGTLRSAA